MTPPSHTPLTNEVFAAVRAWQPDPPWQQVESIQKIKAAWEAEVGLICGNPSLIASILARELPGNEDNDTAIATTLDRFQLLAGHFTVTKQLIGALVAGYLEPLPGPRREKVLGSITSDRSEIGMRAEWLTRTVRTHDFSTEFLHAWFVECMSPDGSGFWAVVGEFAGAKPDTALALAAIPRLEQTAVGRKLQVRLLGALRFLPTLPADAATRLVAMLADLARHLDPDRRIDYLRTYEQPLWRGHVPTAELKSLLDGLDRATAAEQAVGFELSTAAISGRSAQGQHLVVLTWLRGHASPQCTPEQKYIIADVVWRTWRTATEAELGFDSVSLLFAIQPVAADLQGVWRDIQHTLQEMMHAETDRFRLTFRTLARMHLRSLRGALNEGKAFAWLLGEMRQMPWVEAFVAELSASGEAGERRLGAYLFEELKLTPAVGTSAARFDGPGFRLWLAEFQTRNVYETVAAQLVAAAHRIDDQDDRMVQQFQSEAYYQCLNLPGHCLDKIREPAAALPLLQHVVDAADAYYKALLELRASPIKAQQIPGLRRYQYRKAQADSRRMQEMVDKNSIFAQLVSKSWLLYGNRHSYLMEGNLTAPAGLQEFSHSFEMARMESIDPEAAQMRKFGALGVLAEIRRQEDSEPPAAP